MEARVQELEEQVSELTDEVRILRGELRRLRRRLEGEGGSRDERSSVTARSEASEIEASEGYSLVSRVASSQRGLASPSPSIAPMCTVSWVVGWKVIPTLCPNLGTA